MFCFPELHEANPAKRKPEIIRRLSTYTPNRSKALQRVLELLIRLEIRNRLSAYVERCESKNVFYMCSRVVG